MKPTIIAIVASLTSFVIGIGTMQLYNGYILPGGASPLTSPTTTHMVPVDRQLVKSVVIETAGNSSHAATVVNVNAVDTNRLEAVGIKQKLMKREGGYEYWGWRVDVKNNTDEVLTVYVEIEWLDTDGFRVEYTNEVRKIEPGLHAISEIAMLGLQDAAKAKTVRIVKLQER